MVSLSLDALTESSPYLSTMFSELDIEDTLQRLSVSHKISLLSGMGFWNTYAVPSLGIQSLRMSDGPNGVRGTQTFNGVPSSCFPSSTGLGSSFDINLAMRVGQALADECRAKSCHVLLAPTVNTQRSPLGGRGFESFSEDPHLNGTIAAAYINGVQSKGVSATIKHFVCNDQEFERFSISSEVSERALREIYLKPFQIAIARSRPRALMASYNRVNGTHVSESERFLDDILRKEWGYEGLVMSDWTGVYSTTKSIKAGLDLEMPGPTTMRGKAVERALICEKLFISDINDRVRKILGLLKHAQASGIPFDGPQKSVETPQVRQLLRTAAADAIVLLKNEAGLLPLPSGGLKRIAVIGSNAKQAMTSGGGSARLLSTYTVSPLEGITAVAKEIGAEVVYGAGASSHKYLPLLEPYITRADGEPGALLEFWNESPSSTFLHTEPDWKETLKECDWSATTMGSDCFLADGVDETKVNSLCWLRYMTQFTPDEDGDWEFGLSIAGRGNLFIDGELIIDLCTDPAQGESFFGLGTIEARATMKALKAGQTHRVEIRLSNAEFLTRGSPFSSRGGLRLGAVHAIEGEQAVQEAVQLAKISDVVVLIVGLNHDLESEGFDRRDMDLPGFSNRLVYEVVRANPKSVVVNQSGTPVAMPWIDNTTTVLQAFYGGNELGNGLADVLFGKVNPSGKLPLTFPKRLEDAPSHPFFGDRSEEPGKVLYNEGIFVGYRGYEVKCIAPLFPFGHGLSYTTFEYSNLTISRVGLDGTFIASFTIKNTGRVFGREVVQIYITDSECSLPRPTKELKGFVKVELDAGESKSETVCLDREALGFYDNRRMQWAAEEGTFEVLVAASSSDVRLSGQLKLDTSILWTGL